MRQVAVFVDAGFLYVASGEARSGAKCERRLVTIEKGPMLDKLVEQATRVAGGAPLLRVYWYDGAAGRLQTTEQDMWASLPNVKLRLGTLNSAGVQKGVDSLIILDMIELARNHAISDALLVSGDDDLRVGVQLTQSFGVRVHLLGFPSEFGNRSRLLAQEADTLDEWDADQLDGLVAVQEISDRWEDVQRSPVESPVQPEVRQVLQSVIAEFLAESMSSDVALVAGLMPSDPIPREIDAPLLAKAGNALGGAELDQDERYYLRDQFKTAAREEVEPVADAAAVE